MAQHDVQDETLFCERCGISFLWSAEEQRHVTTAPLLCPGCRRLLPTGVRERGLVKWYSRSKQYGFIVRTDAEELFAHRAQVKTSGALRPDDLVEFAVEDSERGPMAVDICVLEHGAPQPARPRKKVK